MVGVVQTYGHYDVTHTQVDSRRELLVNPYLLQFHLAAFLLLKLPLGSLVGLVLDGRAGAGVLELYLRAKRPAFAKVVA